MCERHHGFVHKRRLIATVRSRPDNSGRYVVWDLTPGGYDRHLERLRAESSLADPPPLTPERLRSLLDSIRGPDPDEQRWARYELDAALPDEAWESGQEGLGAESEAWHGELGVPGR